MNLSQLLHKHLKHAQQLEGYTTTTIVGKLQRQPEDRGADFAVCVAAKMRFTRENTLRTAHLCKQLLRHTRALEKLDCVASKNFSI